MNKQSTTDTIIWQNFIIIHYITTSIKNNTEGIGTLVILVSWPIESYWWRTIVYLSFTCHCIKDMTEAAPENGRNLRLLYNEYRILFVDARKED